MVSEKILERRAGLSEEVVAKRRKAGADPVRQRIMERFYEDRDWTAKELSAALGLGTNGLYYHLRILEDAELILPAGGRPGDRGLEKTYRLATNLHVDFEGYEDLGLVFTAMLEATKHDVAEAVYDAMAGSHDDSPDAFVPFVAVQAPAFTTTHEEILEFSNRITGLIQEFMARARELRAMDDDPTSPLRRLKFTYALRERPVGD